MRIIERIKDAVEHTSDSWQQKLLDEFDHGQEPATRARKVIAELVRPLDKPNQVIINDIVSLIYALASNPDPSVDLQQVISTAEMLIHELVEPIPNPDKRLMDELLHVVVAAASARAKPVVTQTPPVQAQRTAVQPEPTQTPAQPPANPVNAAPVAQAAPPQPTSAPQQSQSPRIDQPMIKLIMDEMKEVIKKNQLTDQRLSDVETRLTARLQALSEDHEKTKEKVKSKESELDNINKNLDKFISLYEIVINQYNPFIEHVEEPKKPVTPKVPVPEAQAAPTKVTTSPQTEHIVDNIQVLIEEVKAMTDAEFTTGKEKITKWIVNTLKDSELALSYTQAPSKQDAIKLLLKKSLKAHID